MLVFNFERTYADEMPCKMSIKPFSLKAFRSKIWRNENFVNFILQCLKNCYETLLLLPYLSRSWKRHQTSFCDVFRGNEKLFMMFWGIFSQGYTRHQNQVQEEKNLCTPWKRITFFRGYRNRTLAWNRLTSATNTLNKSLIISSWSELMYYDLIVSVLPIWSDLTLWWRRPLSYRN